MGGSAEDGGCEKIIRIPPVQTLEDSEETVLPVEKIPPPPLQFLDDHTDNALLLSVKPKTIAKKRSEVVPLTYVVRMNREDVVRGILETNWAAPNSGKIWKEQHEEGEEEEPN